MACPTGTFANQSKATTSSSLMSLFVFFFFSLLLLLLLYPPSPQVLMNARSVRQKANAMVQTRVQNVRKENTMIKRDRRLANLAKKDTLPGRFQDAHIQLIDIQVHILYIFLEFTSASYPVYVRFRIYFQIAEPLGRIAVRRVIQASSLMRLGLLSVDFVNQVQE